MADHNNSDYCRQRELEERKLAAEASDPSVRAAHLALAAAYRDRIKYLSENIPQQATPPIAA